MIGVNQNGYAPKKLKEVMDKENLTWRTFADPGAISARWNAGPATYYVIDHKGVIRYKWSGSAEKDIDAALEKVIQEAEGRQKGAEVTLPIRSFSRRAIAEPADEVDRAGITAFRDTTSLQPARQLNSVVRRYLCDLADEDLEAAWANVTLCRSE